MPSNFDQQFFLISAQSKSFYLSIHSDHTELTQALHTESGEILSVIGPSQAVAEVSQQEDEGSLLYARHYKYTSEKHPQYTYLLLVEAIEELTQELYVVYRALYPTNPTTFARPKTMFYETLKDKNQARFLIMGTQAEQKPVTTPLTERSE